MSEKPGRKPRPPGSKNRPGADSKPRPSGSKNRPGPYRLPNPENVRPDPDRPMPPGFTAVFDFLEQHGVKGRAARDALSSGKVRLFGIPIADGTRRAPVTGLEYNPSWPRLHPLHDLFIVHRNPVFAVLYKPANMLAVPAPEREEPDALSLSAAILGRAFAVHRIDEGTSGLMLVARTEEGQIQMKEMLEYHKIERTYTGLCLGVPREGIYRSFLVRDRGDGRRGVWHRGSPPPDAKEAITHVTIKKTFSYHGQPISQFVCTLQTGRTHQIRLHLSDVGCPLLGDTLYGSKVAIQLFPRLALHAQTLCVPTGRPSETQLFNTPLPDDMERFLASHS